ncbi:hypothetical protein [Halopelagius fulvigenes]|uniref:Uncharacterized protein n=1 Tax=Halopelagius fulvigenes TaxID=1198324 RepID=A0ABD5TYL5_9EURY
MHACILGLTDGPAETTTIDSRLDSGFPAIDAESTAYLDGAEVYHGTCANTIDTQTTDVWVDDETGISTEKVDGLREVACDFYADLDAGFVGVDSSDGEWLFDYLGARAGVWIDRAVLDLDAWASDLRDDDTAEAWHVGASDKTDPDNPRISIDYHADAHLSQTDGRETSQLGFRYSWNGTSVRGTAAASGYVAVFTTMATPTFAKWLREELLEYASLPDSDQTFLTETGSDEEFEVSAE